MSAPAPLARTPVDVVAFGMIAPATLLVVDAIPAVNTGAEWKEVTEFISDDAAIVSSLLPAWGVRAGLIGTALGDDDTGHRAIRRLHELGVMGEFRTSAEIRTPYELNISDREGNRTYFWRKDPAVLATLGRADLSLLTEARLLYVDWYDGDAILRPMRRARERGIPIYLNLEHAHEDQELLRQYVPYASLCQVVTDAAQVRLGEAERVARTLLERGVETVIVTLASRGCLAATTQETVRVTPPRVTPVDGCGAGATFSAGFIYAWLQGWDLETSARFAVAAASLKTTVVGPRVFPAEQVMHLAAELSVERDGVGFAREPIAQPSGKGEPRARLNVDAGG